MAAFEEIPSDPRPGRPFLPIKERELDRDLRDLALRLPGAAEGLILGAEFAGPRGVADLIAVSRAHDDLSARLRAGLPFLTGQTDCAVVAATWPRRTRTHKTIARSLGMSEDQALRRLRSLAARGLVVPIGTGYRRNESIAPIGRAYAFEAKVSDWRKGVSQALRYSAWCDAAAVILLETPNDLDSARSRCLSLGLGLAIKRKWVVRPLIGTPNPGFRLALSEKLAKSLSDHGDSSWA